MRSELVLLNLRYKRQTLEREQPNRQGKIRKVNNESSDGDKQWVHKDV